MNNFWKNTLSAFVGSSVAIIVVSVFLMIITFGIIGGLMTSLEDQGKKTSIEENSVLHLKLDQPIIERGRNDGLNFNFNTLEPETGIGLNHILEDLEKAGRDEKVKGLYLNLSGVMASPSTIEDIRDALVKFKESGKWVLAYSENLSQGAYYLASTADEVYLYPEGGMEWKGLFAELMFFKQMLEKLEVDVQVVRGPNNKFKSAVEPFMYDEMSEANREQITVFLQTIWNDWLKDVSASRGIAVDQLNQIADSLSSYNPRRAVELGLIDGLKYGDEVEALIREKLALAEEDELELVDFTDYRHVRVKKTESEEEKKEDKSILDQEKIAVVYAVGAIESGEGDDETIGSDRIARALREAREDEKVKAVVLRVNSPGGSALASDVIWRETQLIKEAGKPFVVSMGDLAASGGYYISCGADKIYANETTLTGSIGVFGLIPVTGDFFKNKLGITFDEVTTNAHSDVMTTTEAMDEHELSVINESVTQIYDRFISLVAEGRGMTPQEVDSIAQGRVWAGGDALEIGLVDELGNLEDAIAAAAELAGISDYKLRELPELIDPLQELLKELGAETSTQIIREQLGSQYEMYERIRQAEKILNSKGVQARLPFMFTIR